MEVTGAQIVKSSNRNRGFDGIHRFLDPFSVGQGPHGMDTHLGKVEDAHLIGLVYDAGGQYLLDYRPFRDGCTGQGAEEGGSCNASTPGAPKTPPRNRLSDGDVNLKK